MFVPLPGGVDDMPELIPAAKAKAGAGAGSGSSAPPASKAPAAKPAASKAPAPSTTSAGPKKATSAGVREEKLPRIVPYVRVPLLFVSGLLAVTLATVSSPLSCAAVCLGVYELVFERV